MANGEWQMANGEWQMANGKWQMRNTGHLPTPFPVYCLPSTVYWHDGTRCRFDEVGYNRGTYTPVLVG